MNQPTNIARSDTGTGTGTAQRSLRNDTSGAIMVMGVFMAVLLCGMLYYLVGIGETILYRERMQDGTDAGVFAAAVLHARGMNLIVLINMIMAAVLAVLVALRVAEAVALAGALLADFLCGVSIFGCGPCAVACGFSLPLHTAHINIRNAADGVEPVVHGILTVGHAGQRAIQYGMPVAGQMKVVDLTRGAYRPPMDFAFVVPLYRPLPVEDEDFSVLCGKAGNIVGSVAGAPVDVFLGVPIVGNLMSSLIGTLASTFPGFFCGSSDGGGGSSVTVEYGPAEAAACEDASEAAEEEDEDVECPTSIPVGGSVGPIDPGIGPGGCQMCPMRVVDDTHLGDEAFQLRVIGIGTERFDENEEGVTVATLGERPDESGFYSTLRNLDRLGVAQAEFYWSCNGGDDCEREDWMWHANWRARLRRFRIGTQLDAVDGFCANASADDGEGGGTGICGSLGAGLGLIEPVVIH
jgi:hypothetical protein